MRYFLFSFTMLTLLVACKNAKTNKKEASAETIYYDYRIWGEEGRDDVTVRLQYKSGGEEGEPIAWSLPTKVLFDGVEIKIDSSRFTGAYYELIKPVEKVRGKHSIVFVDEHGKERREDFNFEPFSLEKNLPETIKRIPFQIKLANFPDTLTSIRLVMTDTSLHSAGVNEEMLIENGIINITEQQLANLTKGPVVLEIYKEEERPIRDTPAVDGKLSMTYGIKREFELTD